MDTRLLQTLHALLCPPGNGVFTVTSGKERKIILHDTLYQTHEPTAVEQAWHAALRRLPETKTALLGICSDNGGGILRGANWGPLYIRNTLYADTSRPALLDLGDVRVIPHLLQDHYLNADALADCRQALYGDRQAPYPVSPLSIAEQVLAELRATYPDLNIIGLGGDHSVSYPLVKTYLQTKARQNKRVGVVHFDAHTDLLVTRLGVDICFGSWVTHVLPFLQTPSDWVQIGIRATGKPQEHWESTFGVKQMWAKEFEKRPLQSLIDELIHYFAKRGITELYITFDIDAISAEWASATGTPEPNGLTPSQATTLIQQLQQHFTIGSSDVVEVAPLVRHFETFDIPPQQTLALAADLAKLLAMPTVA